MQIVAGTWFRENWNAEVTVSSVHSEHDQHFYEKFGFLSVRSNRRGFFPLFGQLFLAIVLGRAPKPIQKRLTRSTSELGSIVRSDLVIDLSGDMLTESHGIKLAVSHFGPLLTAHLLGVPYFVCAQSIGPFSRLRRVAKYLLNRAVLITTREPITTDWLNGLGVEVVQCSDLAFLLTTTAPRPSSKHSTIGVNLSSLYAEHYRSLTQKSIIDELAVALNSLGLPVLLVPHVTGPRASQDDRVILRSLQEKLTCPSQLIDTDLDPNETKSHISTTAIFIGARFHSCIAALSSHVPTVALSYSHKSIGIMSSLGLQDYVLDHKDACAQTIERLVSDILVNPGVATIDRARLTKVKILAEENFVTLAQLFE